MAAQPGRLSVELRPPVGGDKGHVVAELGAGLDAVCFLGDDRGEIASWVVVTALVVVAAIAIVTIVVSKLTATANNIQTP